jgi:hypothetical protein
MKTHPTALLAECIVRSMSVGVGACMPQERLEMMP